MFVFPRDAQYTVAEPSRSNFFYFHACPHVWEILDPPLAHLLTCTAQPKGQTEMGQVFEFARVG